MAILRKLRLVLVLAALGAVFIAASGGGLAAELAKSALVIKTADGKEHRFTVELAATDAERGEGLM
ncbi:MAG: hypothetical protein ACHQF3_14070, partial [Alphaproteobacteria bacterium]